MTVIQNYNLYNTRMSKSLLDKIFFLDKIEISSLVDYGCADASIFELIRFFEKNTKLIGYDNDINMLSLAKEKFPNDFFTSNWSEINNFLHGDTAVLLSSLIHEVYSYGSSEDIDDFFSRIFTFDYVIIRDMIPSSSISRPANMNDVFRVRRNSDQRLLKEFEDRWGTIEDNKNLLHWLLKYDYKENWDREVNENYIPIFKENLMKLIPHNYEIEYYEHYTLPFIKRKVKRDYNIDLIDNTHLKIILKRVNYQGHQS